ncbi:MAG: hypothetical protein ING86_08810 [Methylobacterium sp.]|nr:hypothetical protein [Methylobacterium sp.]
MLKLSPPARDPFWLDILPGVRIQVRPISVADMLVARAAAAESLGTKVEGDLALDRSATVAAGAAFTRSLALSGIVAWEGIGDAGGKPIDPNPVAINQLLEVWPAFDAIDRLYVGPAVTRLDEKNV